MSEGQKRLLFFLYGTPNLVGALLGLVGLLLFFTGVVQDFWLFIVIGLYAVGYLLTPKNRVIDLHLKNQLDAGEIRRELDDLVATVRKRVPSEVLEVVVSIKDSVLAVLPTLIRDGATGDHHTYVIKQTALEYLPETLENYLNLPPAFARLHTLKDGKNAQQLLLEQLRLLDTTMKEIVVDIHRNDTDRLLINGRFLEEKFRKSELAL